MIKQTTVLMATPIAMLATAKNMDLHERSSDIIKGLNETTAGATGYTEANIATDLPAFTAKDPGHSEALEAVSDLVATRIRAALDTVSKRVKPTLVAIENEIKNVLDSNNVTDTIFGAVRVNAVNVEPSFLKSPFFPKALPPTFVDVASIKLADLVKGTFPRMEAADLVELVSVNVPEIQAFLSNPEEVRRVYETIFVEKYYYEVLSAEAISEGVVNINAGGNTSFGNFRPLVIASLLLNKLASMEDPLDGVTGVGLDDYRAGIAVTRDLFSTLLFRFGQAWESRAAAGVVIIDEAVKLGRALGSTQLLEGTLTVGYNRAVLEMFADAESLSLSEFALGYCYSKARGYPPKDIITDRDAICDAWREYTNDVKMGLLQDKSKVALAAYTRVLEGLYQKEEFKSVIDTMNDGIIPSQRLLTRVAAHIDASMFFQDIGMLDSVIKGENSLMNTPLAAVLAGAFDSPIAQEILMINSKNKPASLEQQRKALSYAITTVILKRLIK